MAGHIISDRERIRETIDFLISHQREITVHAESHEISFTSKIIKVHGGSLFADHGETPRLVMADPNHENGDSLFSPCCALVAKFSLRDTPCRFTSQYLGPWNDIVPVPALVVTFPDLLELQDRRQRDRRGDEIPDFQTVLLQSEKISRQDRTYMLDIFDCSAAGVGILVREKDFDLLEVLEAGDKIQDIMLFADHTLVRVGGTVRHKTQVPQGQEQNVYVVGVEFDETLCDFRVIHW